MREASPGLLTPFALAAKISSAIALLVNKTDGAMNE